MEAIFAWLCDPANWSGSGSIPYQLVYHIILSIIAIAISIAIGFPLGVYVGHTGKGEASIVGVANAARALPSTGLLILLVLLIASHISNGLAFVIPTMIVLVLLALPSIINGTSKGIRSIDQSVIDAAMGMGLSEKQLIFDVEIPCAMPLIFSGIRSASLQIVSTATIAAYVSLNGLGRFIIDGRASNNYAEMAGGAILIALLAVVADLTITLIARLATPGGLQPRASK